MDDYDTFTHSWAEDEDLIIDESNPELVPIPQNEIDEIAKSINEKTSNLQRELLTYHYKLKHLPFSALRKLAKKGNNSKEISRYKRTNILSMSNG
jgi:hypothetical protein